MNKKFILIIGIIVSVNAIKAISPPPGGSNPPCWPPPCIPIDGGIGILIAAGAIYGGKKVYDLSKKS